jgi:MarR family transcriptional regulator for hemolysin
MDDAMDRLKNFGFLLKDVSRLYVLRFEQRARDLSLTLVQCKALAHLEKNEGVSQARLAELIDVDAMTMVRILDRMEADSVIERRPDPDDRRARRLYLTGKAKPMLETIWRLAEQTRAEMFAGIPKAEREAFMGVMERLHANAVAAAGQPVDAIDAPSSRPTSPRNTDAARTARPLTR